MRSIFLSMGAARLFVSALLALAAPLPGISETLERPVLLAPPSTNSVRMTFQTATPSRCALRYAAGTTVLEYREPQAATAHVISLGSLASDTRYRYALTCDGSSSRWQGRFRTAPLATTTRSLRFGALGDSGSGTATQYLVASRLAAWSPEFIVHTGDVVYPNGALADYPTKFFDPYGTLLRRAFFLPSIGNHDALNLSAYEAIFSLPTRRSRSGSEHYYSFDYGFLHFTVLSTSDDSGAGSAQRSWLEKDLARAKAGRAAWIIAVLHIPPYSAGPHGNSETVQRDIMAVLEAYPVSLVLAGHEHAYERFAPLSVSGLRSIPLVVTGGGGADLYAQRSTPDGLLHYVAAHHFVGIRATRRSLSGRVLASDGSLIDSFRIH